MSDKNNGFTQLITGLCLFFTALLVVVFIFAISTAGIPDKSNEIGDAISGFASALAFVWLVGGYFLQQHEFFEPGGNTNKFDKM